MDNKALIECLMLTDEEREAALTMIKKEMDIEAYTALMCEIVDDIEHTVEAKGANRLRKMTLVVRSAFLSGYETALVRLQAVQTFGLEELETMSGGKASCPKAK